MRNSNPKRLLQLLNKSKPIRELLLLLLGFLLLMQMQIKLHFLQHDMTFLIRAGGY
jgi:hypothetical protein